MEKNIIIMNAIIGFYVIQRVSEMVISTRNEKWLKDNFQAVEKNPRESLRMKLFHTLWFLSLILEANIRQELQPDNISAFIYIILALCLAVRFHSIEKLKNFWTIKVMTIEHQKIVTSGLYQYVRHPNYLIVILEFIFIPLLFNAYFTMIIFSFFNILVLKKRINLEEDVLMKQPEYKKFFSIRKRFIPYFFFFILSSGLYANEVSYHFNSYDEAKKSINYVKFESTSTKLGFITTGFDGYAKDIKISYQKKEENISDLLVTISVISLDTDVGSRDEKMVKEIMEVEKHPQISVSTTEKIPLTDGEFTKDMIFTIKGKQTVKPVKFVIKKENGKTFISGASTIGLKEAGLPDPSIAIAKVRDLFDLKFSIQLNE